MKSFDISRNFAYYHWSRCERFDAVSPVTIERALCNLIVKNRNWLNFLKRRKLESFEFTSFRLFGLTNNQTDNPPYKQMSNVTQRCSTTVLYSTRDCFIN